MNYKMMGRFIAQILSIEGAFMLPALAISLFCGETQACRESGRGSIFQRQRAAA